jgi:hypothetical protein
MKKLIITFLVAYLSQSQVYSQLKNYNDNGKVKIIAENTTLSITTVDAKLVSDNQVAGLAVAAGAILSPVIDLIVNSVKEKAKKNALAYKGEFKCSTSEENFYKNNDYAALPKITIKRVIKTFGGDDKKAVEIEMVPELSTDKTAFRYFIKDKFTYNYSIAKTKGSYDFIDLNLEIKFKSLSINKDEYKINDLRTTTINIPMIHVGKTTQLSEGVYSGWIPLPPRSNVKFTKKSDDSTEDKTIIKTTSNGKKETTKEETTITKHDVSDYEKIADNTGLYEVEITATETNPYKIKAENKKEIIESSSESATGILKAVIESFTKEKDEEKKDE